MPCTPLLFRRAVRAIVVVASLAASAGCAAAPSITEADVPAWKATALPSVPGVVLEDSGKILNRAPLVKDAGKLAAGTYTLEMVCDGGGKVFFAISQAGKELTEAGAACNGRRDSARITVPASGSLTVSTTSVDAPLLYAYQLIRAS
jgi:hypothetical protein